MVIFSVAMETNYYKAHLHTILSSSFSCYTDVISREVSLTVSVFSFSRQRDLDYAFIRYRIEVKGKSPILE